jgi:hypothetical protein
VVVIITGGIVSLATTPGGRTIVAVLLGAVGLLVIVCIPHNLRIRRVRKAFRSLPKTVKEQTLDLIKSAAEHPTITYLLLDDEPCSEPEIAVMSHVGGLPYAEKGESWPIHTDLVLPRFLLQVRLDEPSLGEQWQGRLIAVFLVFDAQEIVRSYAAPSLEKCASIVSPVTPFRCIRLRSLASSTASENWPIPKSPAQLVDDIPEIKSLLSPFTSDCPGLLSQILGPNAYGYELESPDFAYQGGSPMLIQDPHDPDCDHCARRMRFLFQFGEIIPEFQLGDAGVIYVYGCDDHPEHCTAFHDTY